RHLGLIPANEAQAAQEHIRAIGARIAQGVDLDRLLDLTATAAFPPLPAHLERRVPQRPVRIGVAQDAAFGFYYPGDLEALGAAGARLVPINTLRDARLPEIDGLFIGGGFPESFAAQLEANASLRADIRKAIDAGLPVYAECGGLMYLARSLTWHGETRRMVGAIPGDVVMQTKPVGRGYVHLKPTAAHPWIGAAVPADDVRCHEFHYSSLENLPPDTRFAYRVVRGHGIDGRNDGVVHRNVLASYSHLRATAGHDWAERFVAFVRCCARQEDCRALEELAVPA
ncbi:MAG: hypothetical protein WBP72_16495, partial [Rhodocyclaceae bacterium]